MDDEDKPIEKAEILRRCNVLREGCKMSRLQFGEPKTVSWNKKICNIVTSKHAITISRECWDDLGTKPVGTPIDLGSPNGR